MALDQSLVGVVGACSALFAVFCVLAVIIGCYCLRRARKRSREQLIEETKQKKRELETKLSHHSAPQYMNDTVNSAPSLPPRSNGGGSLARSDTVPQKMAGYRPKILEDNMISNGYRVDSRSPRDGNSANRDSKAVSTIFVGDNKTSPDVENTNLNYNQSNGFIVKGYMRSVNSNESSQNGSVQGQMVYGHPMGCAEGMGHVRHQSGEPLKNHQVIRQSVEVGQDGKYVVARSERQTVDQVSDPTPMAVAVSTPREPIGTTMGNVQMEDGERPPPVLTAGQTRVVNFGDLGGAGERAQKVTELAPPELVTRGHQRHREVDDTPMVAAPAPEVVTGSRHRQREVDETEETQTVWFPPLPEEQSLEELDQLSNSVDGQAEHTASVIVKTSHHDNYKVIRREHSTTHSPMPAWSGLSHPVDSAWPRGEPEGVTDSDERRVMEKIPESGHPQKHRQRVSPERAGNPRANTAQFYQRYADDTNDTSVEINGVDETGHSSAIFPERGPANPSEFPSNEGMEFPTRAKSPAVTFQDDVEIRVSSVDYTSMDFDDEDEDDRAGDIAVSHRPMVSSVPQSHHGPGATRALPGVSKRIKDIIANLPDARKF